MKNEIYFNCGHDGTLHYGTVIGNDTLYYRNVEKGKTVRVDFFVHIKFESEISFPEVIDKIIGDFFQNTKKPEFNTIYSRASEFGDLEILLDQKFPNDEESIKKLLLDKISVKQ